MFKAKKKSAHARKTRVITDLDEDDTQIQERLRQAREEQELRKREAGISAEGLLTGVQEKPSAAAAEGWSLEKGGLAPKRLIVKDRNRDRTYEDDRIAKGIGATFSAETGIRNEDEEMLKYIEGRLAEKRAQKEPHTQADMEEISELERMKQQLYEVPTELQSSRQDDEAANRGMLSNQVLSGIPEIDLGMETKMQAIADTELAKQKLAQKEAENRAAGLAKVDTELNYARARFMLGKRSAVGASATAGGTSELEDHTELYRQAKQHLVRSVGDDAKTETKDSASAAATHGEDGGDEPAAKRPAFQRASDDRVFERYRQRQRRY